MVDPVVGRVSPLSAPQNVDLKKEPAVPQFATGVNLWEEWAKIEVAQVRGERYQRPEVRRGFAGVINCLARQEYPDTSAYDDPEVVWRGNKKHHAGLILASPDAERVRTLLESYSQRFASDFLAVMPPLEKAPA